MSNTRRHSRLELRLSAVINLTDGGTFRGTTENASFSGLLLACKNPCPLTNGETCNVELTIDSKTGLSVHFECVVIRIEEFRIALQFASYEDKDYVEHYKNLMLLNSPDPEALLREIQKHGFPEE